MGSTLSGFEARGLRDGRKRLVPDLKTYNAMQRPIGRLTYEQAAAYLTGWKVGACSALSVVQLAQIYGGR